MRDANTGKVRTVGTSSSVRPQPQGGVPFVGGAFCTGKRVKDGEPCRARRVKGKQYCVGHLRRHGG